MMLSERVFEGIFAARDRSLWPTRHTAAPDLHGRNCGREISHAHQIVGGAGKSKNPVHFAHPQCAPAASAERSDFGEEADHERGG